MKRLIAALELDDISDDDLVKLLEANGVEYRFGESRAIRILRLEHALYGDPAKPPLALRRVGVKAAPEPPASEALRTYTPPTNEEKFQRKVERRRLQREQKKEKRRNETPDEYEARIRKRRAYEAGRKVKSCC